MPKDIHTQDSSQQRASRLLLAMGVIVLLGALAYFGLTLAVNRRTPATPTPTLMRRMASRWITKVPSGPSVR